MNRMIIVGIVVGVTAVAAAGGAYYYTAKHPNAPRAESLGGGVAALLPAAPKASDGPPPPPPGPPSGDPPPGAPPPEGAVMAPASADAPPEGFHRPTGPVTLEAAIAAFNPAKDHFVWTMPPGVHAKGPFSAEITVLHAGKKTLSRTVALIAEYPEPGSRPQYPRTVETVRLAPDSGWAGRIAELKGSVDSLRAKSGPAAAEINVSSDFKTEIAADQRAGYCGVGGEMPDVRVYLDDGSPLLTPVDISGSALMFKQALVSGCKG